MVLRSAASVFALAGLLVVPSALAQANASRPAASQSPGSVANSMSLLRALAGEWQGTIQGRGLDGKVSSSLVNASIRLENSGSSVAARFDGFLFGKDYDGGSVWRQDGAELSSAWMDSRLNESVRAQSSGVDSANSVGFSGQMALPGAGKLVNVRQVVRVLSPDHVSIEWFVLNDDGKQLSVLSLDLNRLAKGERSAAASRFDEPVMAALRQDASSSRSAGARDE